MNNEFRTVCFMGAELFIGFDIYQCCSGKMKSWKEIDR